MDLECRERAIEQVLTCEDCSDVVSYIELLETLVKLLSEGKLPETDNERDIVRFLAER